MEHHLDLVRKWLIKLDQKNFCVNLAKRHFDKDPIEKLGHRITQSGITPLSNKTDAIQKLSSPSNLKKLRSFNGSVHHLGKFIQNLSQMCHPPQTFTKKTLNFSGQMSMKNTLN